MGERNKRGHNVIIHIPMKKGLHEKDKLYEKHLLWFLRTYHVRLLDRGGRAQEL